MTIVEVKSALQQRTPVQFHSAGEMAWLPEGWHDATISALDEDKKHPRVWLNIGCSSGIEVHGKKDIRELLRVKQEESA